MTHRFTHLMTLAAAAAVLTLAGCASSVKLDEPTKAPISSVPVDGSANANAGASSAVAPVVTTATESADPVANLAKVIYFDYDSFVVKPEFTPTIEGYAKALSTAKTKRMLIEGHTDSRGGREYNLALGQKRAEATVKALTLLGVSAEQLEAVSFGKERPAAEGDSEDAHAQNRRAEFKSR
jgi:peptidoglycan-associated lipoprotein